MRLMGTQIGFMLGGCAGEGITTGINLNKTGDEQGKTGSETGGTGQDEGITPGQGTRGLEDNTENPDENPAENPHRGSLVKVRDSQLEETLGEDPHEFKEGIVGGHVSRYDIYRDKKTGYLFLIPKGGGDSIPTYRKV